MKYIYVGKIVSTHALKGEVKLISTFRFKNKVFKEKFPLYIGENKEKEIVATYRKHKQYDMLTFLGYSNINEILKYMKKSVYANKDDIELKDGEVLDEDLKGLAVYIEKEKVGTVVGIRKRSPQDLLIIKNAKREFLIPYVSDIILNINLSKKEMYLANIKGLIS